MEDMEDSVKLLFIRFLILCEDWIWDADSA